MPRNFLLVSDLHLSADKLDDKMKTLDFIRDTVFNNQIDRLVILGDLFDSAAQPVSVYNTAIEFIHDISLMLPVHMLVGNHDLTEFFNDVEHALVVFKYIPNITVHSSTKVDAEYDTELDKLLLYFPYIPDIYRAGDLLDQAEAYQKTYKCNPDNTVIFGHFIEHPGLLNELYDISHHVYSGHIHNPHVEAGITYIGSTGYIDFKDTTQVPHGAVLLDMSDLTGEIVINNKTPIYIDIEDVADINEYIKLDREYYVITSNYAVKQALESSYSNVRFVNVRQVADRAADSTSLSTALTEVAELDGVIDVATVAEAFTALLSENSNDAMDQLASRHVPKLLE